MWHLVAREAREEKNLLEKKRIGREKSRYLLGRVKLMSEISMLQNLCRFTDDEAESQLKFHFNRQMNIEGVARNCLEDFVQNVISR